MMVRAVVFDIGGVLTTTPDTNWQHTWEAKLNLEPGQLIKSTLHVWQAGSVGALSEHDVSASVREILGLAAFDFEAMMTDIWSQYLGELNEELAYYFRSLRPSYRTAILSNSFVGAREKEQLRYRMQEMADFIVYSHEVGMSKPDPRIYWLTCERLGIPPEATIFLDDVEANIEAARIVGMHAIHFKSNAQAIADINASLALTEFA